MYVVIIFLGTKVDLTVRSMQGRVHVCREEIKEAERCRLLLYITVK